MAASDLNRTDASPRFRPAVTSVSERTLSDLAMALPLAAGGAIAGDAIAIVDVLLALGAFLLAFGARHGIEAHLALRARRPVPAHAHCRAEELTLRAVAAHWWQEALLGVGMLTLAMLVHRGSVGMLLLIAAGFFAGRAGGNALEAHLLARWERASGIGLWVWSQERWYSGRRLFAGFDFDERDFDAAPPPTTSAPPPRTPLAG